MTNWAQHRQLSLIETVFGLHKLLTQNYTRSAAGGGGSAGTRAVTVDQVAASLRLMVDAGDALAFGDSIHSQRFRMAAPTDAAVRAVLFSNACASTNGASDPRFVSRPDCATFERGVMTHGLHSAYLQLQRLFQSALSLVTQVRRECEFSMFKMEAVMRR